MKKEKLAFYSALMIISGLFGWIYEVIFYFINDGCKTFYLRGSTFLPFIDIYVIGALLIYFLNKDTKSKLKVFIKSGVICGILEYLAGLLIYVMFDGKRSWDYNIEILNFGNINGFICLRSVLFFALSGLILIYIIVPFIKKMLNSKYKNIFSNIFIILLCIYLVDEVYNISIAIGLINLPSAGDIYRSLGFKYW